MPRHLRVPGLLDLFTADAAGSIHSLDSHPRIDRVFDMEGPLATRLVRNRISSVFHVGGRLWPAFLSRDDPGRRKDSAALHERLSGEARRVAFDAEALDRLAALLTRAEAGRPEIGAAFQQAVGRAFHAGFVATPGLYEAADILANWPQARFFRAIRLRLSGAVRRARAEILAACNDDTYCAHAISLALPNLIATFERMRALRLETSDPAGLEAGAVVSRCLGGPKTLMRGVRPLVLPPDPRLALRRPNVKIDVPETRKPLRRGAIVRLDRSKAQLLDRGLVFSEGSWAACPAREWVPALLAEIWRRSIAAAGSPP
jgi:hypothetical protein